MKSNVLIAFGLLLATAGTAVADVVVASGGRIKLDMMGAFDQACHSIGPMTVNILQAPQGGALSIERVQDYPNFPAFNTRSRCNTSKLPETRLMYQSSAGYLGDDTVSVEWIGPNGRLFRRSYRISVRPGVIQPPEVGETPVTPRRRSHHRAPDVASHHGGTVRRPSARHPRSSPPPDSHQINT